MAEADSDCEKPEEGKLEDVDDRLAERGVWLYCPLCRRHDAYVQVNLGYPSRFSCEDCGGEFMASDVRRVIDAAGDWDKILAWVETLPVLARPEEE